MLVLKYYFYIEKFIFLLFIPLNMSSQKHKGKQKQKLLQKASRNYLSIKAIFERNEPSTSSHTDTHSLDLQSDWQVSPEIIQPEETSNHNHPNNVPNENNHEYIKIQNIWMFLLTESQKKIYRLSKNSFLQI